MKKNIVTLLMIGFTCFGFAQKKTAAYYTYKTECLGVELDGSQTVKAWGNGRNKKDAVEQAQKNALRDVIFKGISEGKQECNQIALLNEVNAEEKYQEYFNVFFKDGGEYKNFISLEDERTMDKIKRDRKRTPESVTHGLVVRILRSELKKKLIADSILKIN